MASNLAPFPERSGGKQNACHAGAKSLDLGNMHPHVLPKISEDELVRI
jgi:hypothetical protein